MSALENPTDSSNVANTPVTFAGLLGALRLIAGNDLPAELVLDTIVSAERAAARGPITSITSAVWSSQAIPYTAAVVVSDDSDTFSDISEEPTDTDTDIDDLAANAAAPPAAVGPLPPLGVGLLNNALLNLQLGGALPVPQPIPIVNQPGVVPQPTPIVNQQPGVVPQPAPIVNQQPGVVPQPAPVVNLQPGIYTAANIDSQPEPGPGGRWYAVTVGTAIGVFNSWAVVSVHVIGVPGSSFHRYSTWSVAVQAFKMAERAGAVRRI